MANPLKGHPNLRRAGRLLEFSHMQEMTHSDFHEKTIEEGVVLFDGSLGLMTTVYHSTTH